VSNFGTLLHAPHALPLHSMRKHNIYDRCFLVSGDAFGAHAFYSFVLAQSPTSIFMLPLTTDSGPALRYSVDLTCGVPMSDGAFEEWVLAVHYH